MNKESLLWALELFSFNFLLSLLLCWSPSPPSCRFLQVSPASVEDERLLVGIVAFLNAHFKQLQAESASDLEDEDLRWILELLLDQVTMIFLESFQCLSSKGWFRFKNIYAYKVLYANNLV